MRGAFWWIDRWRQSSGYTGLRLDEQGAFRNLCDELWLRDGVLPNDDRTLANISGDAVRWPAIRDAVLAKFYPVAGGWRNKTHDAVYEDSKKRAKKQADYRERRKKRNETGNVTGNEHGNDPRNVPSSPFTVHSSHVIPPPPAREEPEAVNAECTELSNALTEAVKRASEITGRPGIEILADAMVRGKGPPITNPGGCTMASRILWRITVDRVNGFVAAWQSDRKGKGRKSGAAPSWDRADASQADLDARAMAWIDSNWRDADNFKHKSDLLRSLLAHKCPPDLEGAVTMILIARNPHLTKGEAA